MDLTSYVGYSFYSCKLVNKDRGLIPIFDDDFLVMIKFVL
jgi:hypothetical protein